MIDFFEKWRVNVMSGKPGQFSQNWREGSLKLPLRVKFLKIGEGVGAAPFSEGAQEYFAGW